MDIRQHLEKVNYLPLNLDAYEGSLALAVCIT